MELNYRVVRGSPGNRDITMTLRDPRAIEVVSDQRVNYHNHRIVIGDSAGSRGDYTLCLDNSYSYDDKVVAFSIYLLDEKGEYLGEQPTLSPNNALSIELEVFESSTRRVKANLNRAENEMNLMRTVSLTDRSIAEQNFESVNWYGTLNTVVIVTAAAVQVFLIRSLLTEGSNVGKLLRSGRL
ncbi:Emp24/gp25L/p24 family protein [Oesophagostomum dentatum]|uniref:Emp24/gp25L/p24 family protein n=1 Tax=Oesophagostomum dentatum TaxID=61180 RepID=A0A0B1SFT1_OESDE|nr:Emp24/gp25L/p24 family protein [Oesophagostomum dentatum]